MKTFAISLLLMSLNSFASCPEGSRSVYDYSYDVQSLSNSDVALKVLNKYARSNKLFIYVSDYEFFFSSSFEVASKKDDTDIYRMAFKKSKDYAYAQERNYVAVIRSSVWNRLIDKESSIDLTIGDKIFVNKVSKATKLNLSTLRASGYQISEEDIESVTDEMEDVNEGLEDIMYFSTVGHKSLNGFIAQKDFEAQKMTLCMSKK